MPGRTISELGHVQRADTKRSGGGEPRQYGRGRRCDPPLAHLRAAFRQLALDVIHVLVRERHTIQRAFRLAARERAVRSLGSSQSFILLDAYECIDDRLPAPNPFKHPSRQLGRGERAAAKGARDLSERQLGRLLARSLPRRCTAAKLAGSISSARSIFAAAKRAAVGATARAMRSASIGASGTRAAVAMAVTRSAEISSGISYSLAGAAMVNVFERLRCDAWALH